MHKELKFFLSPKLNHPKYEKNKFLLFFIVIFLMFIFTFFTQILAFIIDTFIIKHFYHISANDIIKKNNNSVNEYLFSKYTFGFALLYIPIIEELTYRSYINLKKKAFLLSVFLYFITVILPFHNFEMILSHEGLIKIVLFLPIFFLINSFFSEISNVLKKYYGAFFYFSALFFGLVHIQNFFHSLPLNIIIFSPLFVLSQFFLGVFAGYLRIRLGIVWAILLHMIFNLPYVLLYLLEYYGASKLHAFV